jgi:hypothetical protein
MKLVAFDKISISASVLVDLCYGYIPCLRVLTCRVTQICCTVSALRPVDVLLAGMLIL